MQKYFSIGQAAKVVHTTSETLRHYDRIGLVKPTKKDSWTKYRYYTKQDIVQLNTIRALQQMDLSLQEIKTVLAYDDLQKIVDFLAIAEKKADEKIASLQYSKSKIQSARENYERKLRMHNNTSEISVRDFPQRVILLSDTLETPTLDNLWNYLRHFYDRVPPALKEQFTFEDVAGIYTEKGVSKLFAVCTHYGKTDGLKVLPKGKYLCADCSKKDREQKLRELLQLAKTNYHTNPPFTVQLIVVSGILQWNYELQVYIGNQNTCSQSQQKEKRTNQSD